MPFNKGDPKPPGSGRKKGSSNKRTLAIVRAVVAEGMTPLEYMLDVLRDPDSTGDDRKWAAGAAAPYVHPRLSTVESRTVEVEPDPDADLERMTPEELRAEREQFDRQLLEMGYAPIGDGKPEQPAGLAHGRFLRRQ
jgi:hypothetical protein